ncbi:hypothetical protein [uncultured Dialister sp.]|uniref:hypothetical protein n=1 Tax=Dialister succinatiphilus TaxID=487173 RepID=UPI00266FBCEB|nr:hypothetical protein [uncultured Dialister sp.]
METLLLHARQETIRKEFPTLLKHCGFMPDRKLFAKGFLPGMTPLVLLSHRKLWA